MKKLLPVLLLGLAGCVSTKELDSSAYSLQVSQITPSHLTQESDLVSKIKDTEKAIAIARKIKDINERISRESMSSFELYAKIIDLTKELDGQKSLEFEDLSTRLKNYTYYSLSKKERTKYIRLPTGDAIFLPIVLGFSPLIWLGDMAGGGFGDGTSEFFKDYGKELNNMFPKDEFNTTQVYDVHRICPYREEDKVILENVSRETALDLIKAILDNLPR